MIGFPPSLLSFLKRGALYTFLGHDPLYEEKERRRGRGEGREERRREEERGGE